MIVKCSLCPIECRLENYQIGSCRVRMHLDGKLVTLVYAKPCAVHVDPIEKKPIFHMLPKTAAFSIATAGCNLTCKFCQNWEISQAKPEKTRSYHLPPDEVVSMALSRGCRSIAYTYSEPSVFYEYMYETSALAHRAGLKNIWVTAGYINPEPLKELAPLMDAANMDLKGFTESYYRDVCGGSLKPVLEAIELACSLGIWVELTNLVVPTLNDDLPTIRKMCRWIRQTLGPDVPVHFSRFYPHYKLKNLPPTPLETLVAARNIALEEGINYVYTGNVPYDRNSDTFCPECGRLLIQRLGYHVAVYRVENGSCYNCRTEIAGIWT